MSLPNSIPRNLNEKLGERVSILDFGADASGVKDSTDAINTAIKSAESIGRGIELYAPAGQYMIGGPGSVVFDQTAESLIFSGDARATVFVKNPGSNIPQGQGIIDIRGAGGLEFRSFILDGQRVTPAGVNYSTVNGDPMLPLLTKDSSVWIHERSNSIKFRDVVMSHSNGYSILIDPYNGEITDVSIIDSVFENNRQFLFGVSDSDLNYGSWAGCIFVNGNGNNAGASQVLNRFLVKHCRFRRNTGNCLWSHLHAFNELHSNFQFHGNTFEDCGLDGILVGGVVGGSVHGNTFRRIGYICRDDNSASVPKWLQNAWAVGLDTAGLVKGVNYKGNTFIDCNGGCMDLDGYSQGVISGNVVKIALPSEPEYAEDNVAAQGPSNQSFTYGCQISNTNNHPIAGTSVEITGNTFLNLPVGAIRLVAARGCHVNGNLIQSSATPLYPPIGLANKGGGTDVERSYNNVITQNMIDYNPATSQPVIVEDASTTGVAFQATDKNWVFSNRNINQGSKAFEFLKDPTTISTTRVTFSSVNATLASGGQETIQQHEAAGPASLFRIYFNDNSTVVLAAGLARSLYNTGGAVVGGPFFNVSLNGTAKTGSMSTGGRTTLPHDDVIATGKLYGDAFIALSDVTLVYPQDPQANLYGASIGLIRYNSTSRIFQQSTSVSVGQRVWSNLGGSPGAPDTSVQFNSGGSFAGSANLIWDNTLQRIVVTGVSGSDGIVSTTSIRADQGFDTVSISSNAIQAPKGGVYANIVTADSALYLKVNSTNPAVPPANYGGLYYKGGTLFSYYNSTTTAWQTIDFGVAAVAPQGPNGAVQYNQAGAFAGSANVVWKSTVSRFTFTGVSNTAAIYSVAGYIQSEGGFVSSMDTWNAIQAASGGGYSGAAYSVDPYSASGTARGGYISLNKLVYDNYPKPLTNLAFASDSVLLWSSATNATGTAGYPAVSSTYAINTNTYINAAVGFVTNSAQFNSIQIPNGGVYGRSLRAIRYSAVGTNSGADPTATTGDSISAGCMQFRTDLTALRYHDGTNWVTINPGAISGSFTVNCIPYATGLNTLATTNNMFWETATNSIGTTGIGVNGLSSASSVRISLGRVDNGMYLTSIGDSSGHMSAGSSYNGSAWVAKSTSSIILGGTAGVFGIWINNGLSVGNAIALNQVIGINSTGMAIYLSTSNALQIVNSSNVWGGAAVGAIGINGNNTSCFRISNGTVDNGMYMTTVNNTDFHMSNGSAFNGSSWISRNTNVSMMKLTDQYVYFYSAAGTSIGAAHSWTVMGYHASWGLIMDAGSLYIGNSQGVYIKDNTGTGQRVITLWNDNNVYIDNGANLDIWLRPGTGRFVFFGTGGSGVNVVPGAQPSNLGHPSYIWGNLYAANINCSGTATGLVKSVNNIGGAITLVAGGNITLTPSGQNITITASAGALPGSVSFNTVTINPSGAIYLYNSVPIYWLNVAQTSWATSMTLSSDNNLYIDNALLGTDIYIRPASGRFLFIGNPNAYVCGNGDNQSILGHPSYRWGNLYTLAGTCYGNWQVNGNLNAAGRTSLGNGAYPFYTNGGLATLSLGEATSSNGYLTYIEFHNAGSAEMYISLSNYNMMFGASNGSVCAIALRNGANNANTLVMHGNGSIYMMNNTWFYMKDTNGTDQGVLILGNDNAVYLANPTGQHIYMRCAGGGYVIMNGANGILPNGDNQSSLGINGWRWNHLQVQDIDCAGNVAGLVKSVAASGYAALYGNVTFIGGGIITVQNSGNSVFISANAQSTQYFGGTGVTISGTTISIGQNVATNAAVTFGGINTSYIQINGNYGIDGNRGIQGTSLSVTGVVQAGNSGITFQNSNFTFQVDASGNISGSGNINMNGGSSAYQVRNTVVINSSGQFVGPGINIGQNGVGCGGVNPSVAQGSGFGATLNSGGYINLGGFSVRVLGGIIVN